MYLMWIGCSTRNRYPFDINVRDPAELADIFHDTLLSTHHPMASHRGGLYKTDWNPPTHECGSFGPALARSLACHHTTALGKLLFVNIQY